MRLFLAIALPQDQSACLMDLQCGLQGARWLPPENLHLTLCFLGETEPRQAQDLDAALTALRAPRFSLTLSGLGVFGTASKLRSLWAGVEPSNALTRLQAKTERAARGAGLPLAKKKFRPHVTLARFKGRPGARHYDFISRHALFRTAPFTVEDIVLFSSILAQSGATYRAEARYPLGE